MDKLICEFYNKGQRKPYQRYEDEKAEKELNYFCKRFAMYTSLRLKSQYMNYANDGYKLTFVDKSNGHKAIFYNVTLK